jgi:hypothetical protein
VCVKTLQGVQKPHNALKSLGFPKAQEGYLVSICVDENSSREELTEERRQRSKPLRIQKFF